MLEIIENWVVKNFFVHKKLMCVGAQIQHVH